MLDCYEVYQKSNQSPGVYPIQVDIQTIVDAYCLEEGWTVIQSRGQYGNPIDFFYKTWSEYKSNFGKPGKQLNNIKELMDSQLLKSSTSG